VFVRFPPSHHHHHLHLHSVPHSTTPNNPARCPSPLLRDVGPIPNPSTHLRSEDEAAVALPFPKGCGRLILARKRNRGGGKTRGDPGIGRPTRYVTKHEPRYTSWPFLFISCHPNDHFLLKADVANDQRIEFPPQPCKPHRMVSAPSFDAT